MHADLDVVLTVDRLSHRYRRGAPALRDLSFTLPAGAMLGVLGGTGAGKSTLLRSIAGLLRPTTGAVQVGGVSTAQRALLLNGTIAYVSADIPLPVDGTLGDLERFLAPLHPRWDAAIAAILRDRFALSTSQRMNRLSPCAARQIALLCALAAQPPVLVLDEPFRGADPPARDVMQRALLAQASASNTTVVLATAEVSEVEPTLTHAALLIDGTLAAFGATDALAQRFCRCRVVGDDFTLAALAREQPWLGAERAGRMLRLTVDVERTPIDAPMLERRYPAAQSIDIEPLTLPDLLQALSERREIAA